VVGGDGRIDRRVLGRRALAEEDGLAFLEALVYPRVQARREAWMAAALAGEPRPALLVCEVPVLFEAGIEDQFDAVLVVTAPEEIRRARVEARGQDFDALSARQLPEADKVARADRAYSNEGSLEDLRAWVSDRFAEYAGRPCGTTISHE
jgi:dephospho-CoA kinase